MKKKLYRIILFIVGIVALIAVVGIFIMPHIEARPPSAVWISNYPHIVIFQHRRYISPFDAYGRQDLSPGYMIDNNGEKTHFFTCFAGGRMRFYEAQTFFDFNADIRPIMYGYWQRMGRRFRLEADGSAITFTRTRDYEPPNTSAWLPGLESLHGIWETQDGRLRLDLENAYLVRTENDGFISGIISSILTSPRFHGVYDPRGANICLLISGLFTPHTGTFMIVISENGNLRGHSFAPVGGGRFMRGNGALDGDVINLQFNSGQFSTISGDWSFPYTFSLYRVSN